MNCDLRDSLFMAGGIVVTMLLVWFATIVFGVLAVTL